MILHLKTAVAQNYIAILEGFDRDLFKALSPLFPRLKIIRFDGSMPGDRVEIELQAGPLRQRWTSLITERQVTDQAAWFTDQGQELPPPLRFWRHQHLVTKEQGHSCIHDIIEFKTGARLLDLLVYPVLYFQFKQRAPIYRRVFGHIVKS